jgi:hypothetical protein
LGKTPLYGGGGSHPQRGARRTCGIAQGIERFRADATRGEVHDTLERGVIGSTRNQTQVGQGILDFGAFEEPQSPIDPIGHARIQKCFFEHP